MQRFAHGLTKGRGHGDPALHHAPRRKGGLSARPKQRVSKATAPQTTSQKVAHRFVSKGKACTSFASAGRQHSCHSNASSPSSLPSIQLHGTARLTADPSGAKPAKLISSFEMVTGNCR